MATFAVTYTYDADATERLDATRPDHRAYLRGLAESGALRVSGPWVGGAPGALLIFGGDSEEAVRGYVAGDPFVLAGLVASFDVREWNPVTGAIAEHV